MNNYVKIDGYKYRTMAAWLPIFVKPATMRVTRLGKTDVTYANMNVVRWKGIIEAQPWPDPGFGTPYLMRTVLAAGTNHTFTDHSGVDYTVSILGSVPETSVSPMLDAEDNVIYFDVEIISENS